MRHRQNAARRLKSDSSPGKSCPGGLGSETEVHPSSHWTWCLADFFVRSYSPFQVGTRSFIRAKPKSRLRCALVIHLDCFSRVKISGHKALELALRPSSAHGNTQCNKSESQCSASRPPPASGPQASRNPMLGRQGRFCYHPTGCLCSARMSGTPTLAMMKMFPPNTNLLIYRLYLTAHR